MDTNHVIFSANADSLDSWDIENLKFLKKISVKNPNHRRSDMETLSYVSERDSLVQECEALLETAIYTSGSEHILKQHIKEVPTGTALLIPRDDVSEVSSTIVKKPSPVQRVISTLPTIDLNNNVMIPQLVQISSSHPKLRKSIFESLDMTTVTISSAKHVLHQKPLEDCYVMDVLMVRNESVLTDNSKNTSSSPSFRNDKSPPRLLQVVTTLDDEQDKPESSNTPESIRKEMISLRYSSSSPTSISSEDSFASAIEKGFFEMEKTVSAEEAKEAKDTPIPIEMQPEEVSGRSSISSTVQYIRKAHMKQPRPDECPFCGSCTRANSFTYARRREDLNETEASSLVPTVGGEPPPLPTSTRSLSPPPPPYYVQLREGLSSAAILSTVSSNTPTPNNFSLNRSGQLVIDYSSNWKGLESYVKSLTLSTAIMRKKSMKSLRSRRSN